MLLWKYVYGDLVRGTVWWVYLEGETYELFTDFCLNYKICICKKNNIKVLNCWSLPNPRNVLSGPFQHILIPQNICIICPPSYS